jgi:hypothetical protein
MVPGSRIDLVVICQGANAMSKDMNAKKQTRKPATKTLLQKRAAKQAKRSSKGAMAR